MKPVKLAIEYFGKIGFGQRLWFDLKDCVSVAEQSGLSGKEKKAMAVERLKTLGWDLAEGLIETGIQLAWLWLQAYLGRTFKVRFKNTEQT